MSTYKITLTGFIYLFIWIAVEYLFLLKCKLIYFFYFYTSFCLEENEEMMTTKRRACIKFKYLQVSFTKDISVHINAV